MRVAFTGHRDLDANFDRAFLKEYLSSLISNGADIFYVGMARGFDLEVLYALSILKIEKKLEAIPNKKELLADYKKSDDTLFKIIGCYPFNGHKVGYTGTASYSFSSLENCLDEKVYCSPFYFNGCMNVRNKYLVDNCDMLVAYFNPSKIHSGTANTIRMAVSADIPYINIYQLKSNNRGSGDKKSTTKPRFSSIPW